MSRKKKSRKHPDRQRNIKASAPDRDRILEFMEGQGHPLSRNDIAASMGVESEGAREILRRRLRAMVRDGQLIRNRRDAYGLAAKMDLVSGRVSAHSDGFGFVIPDSGGDDLYLSPRQMKRVMNGDRVLASVVGLDQRGRKEGAVREVLEHAHEEVVGRFVEESGIGMVVPDNPKLNHDVLIPPGESAGARPGQVVVARLVSQPTEHKPPVGKVIEILGRAGAPGMATEIAIRDFSLPHQWPKGVEKQASAFGETVPEDMKDGRLDLRDLPLVTIDGADARDFDDAVYARRTGKGWRLVVAIADVAAYVRPGSALDNEAQERATSVYFPSRVIPMLPEALSNGLCSLKPGEDRLCLACDMSVNKQGVVTQSRFAAAVMHSQARLTYQQVWDYLETRKLRHPSEKAEVRKNLDDLHGLYGVLQKARRKRGAIDFESQDIVFRFDSKGAISELANAERNDAHKIIEECMILANVQAAHLLERKQVPAPFRVHPPPPELKLEALARFLKAQGIKVPWRDEPKPADFDAIASAARGRPDEKLIMAVLLRAQSLAVYKLENDGHFGLALPAYAHFTSPIRRYPDLLVHRAIHHIETRSGRGEYLYGANEMKRLSEHCSQRSRRAEEAERDVADRLKCIYMERHVGDEFDGIVSGVTSFGLFVELDLGNVNGLVHVTGLPNDYYHFNPDAHSLTGERQGKVFRLADRLRVRVTSVNVSDRKVDFELA